MECFIERIGSTIFEVGNFFVFESLPFEVKKLRNQQLFQ